MQFNYTPTGGDTRSWPFEPDRLMSAEAEVIERKTGMTFSEWRDKVQRGSIVATHALLFVYLKREIPTLKYDELQFQVGEVSITLDDDESAAMLAVLEEKAKTEPLTDGEEGVLALLRASTPEPADGPGDDEAASPEDAEGNA